MHKNMPATTWQAWVHVFNFFTCLLDRGGSQSNIHVFIDTENEGLDTFIDLFSGWMGDLTTFAKDIETYVEKNKNIMYQEYANNNLFAYS